MKIGKKIENFVHTSVAVPIITFLLASNLYSCQNGTTQANTTSETIKMGAKDSAEQAKHVFQILVQERDNTAIGMFDEYFTKDDLFAIRQKLFTERKPGSHIYEDSTLCSFEKTLLQKGHNPQDISRFLDKLRGK